MSQYYKARKTWGLYDPTKKEPHRISRSKIDLFLQCPRCFYLDQRLGISRPASFPLTLNNAVDQLMKKEFDLHRAKGSKHPLVESYGIDAIPYDDSRMEEWRDALKRGISTVHAETNLFVRGGVDDVWVKPDGELIIVDYKATSKDAEITLDDEWKIMYKRQMEIYQWLFKQNGFKVSNTGYFVYVNGKTDVEAFDGRLEFDVTILPYLGKTDWIPAVLRDLKKTLDLPLMPAPAEDCDYCAYRKESAKAAMAEKTPVVKKKKPGETASLL